MTRPMNNSEIIEEVLHEAYELGLRTELFVEAQTIMQDDKKSDKSDIYLKALQIVKIKKAEGLYDPEPTQE